MIEKLTECYVLIQGNTLSAIGPHKGLREVRSADTYFQHNFSSLYYTSRGTRLRSGSSP